MVTNTRLLEYEVQDFGAKQGLPMAFVKGLIPTETGRTNGEVCAVFRLWFNI